MATPAEKTPAVAPGVPSVGSPTDGDAAFMGSADVDMGQPVEHEWPFSPHAPIGAEDQSAKLKEKPDAAFLPDIRWDEYQLVEHEWVAKLPPISHGTVAEVPFDAENPETIEMSLAALGRDGAVVLTDAVTADMDVEQLLRDLAPYAAAADVQADGAKHVGALPARSSASHPMVSHPALVRLMDAIIGRQALRMDAEGCKALTRSRPNVLNRANLNNGVTEENTPGGVCPTEFVEPTEAKKDMPAPPEAEAAAQEREENAGKNDEVEMPPAPNNDNVNRNLQQLPWGLDLAHLVLREPGGPPSELNYPGSYCIYEMHTICEHRVATQWALDDASCPSVAIGSHLWPRERDAYPEELTPVPLKKGSILLTLSATWQHSGVNEASTPAASLAINFNTSLLRSEENMYLSNPPEIACDYPVHIQKLVGYTIRGANCGTFADFQHPAEALEMCRQGGFEGHDRVDWARPANKIPFEPTPYDGVPHSLQEPVYGDRWDQFEKNKHKYIRELPPPGAPVHFKWNENDDSQFEMFLAAMYRDGCMILENAVPPEICDQIQFDMEPYVECAGQRPESNTARNGDSLNTRADAIPSRSQASWPICAHPALLAISEAILGRQVCNMDSHELERKLRGRAKQIPWLLNMHQIIQVQPGSGAQGLHRDAGVFAWDTKVLGLEVEISTIWALHDFTEEVPRSHRWPKYRQPKAEECYQAVMPKGSCIIYSGDVFHSAAANATEDVKRWGLNVDYCPAFITEEEIEILGAMSGEKQGNIGPRLRPDIQRLCGYDLFGPNLGHYADMAHPREALKGTPVNWAAATSGGKL